MAKIDDLVNKCRRYNFRIRGLPKSVTDMPAAVSTLIKELIPDIRSYRLELESIGPWVVPDQMVSPRYFFYKPHFVVVKEEVLKRAFFSNIYPTTIQKRQALRPLLVALTLKIIKYLCFFPSVLNLRSITSHSDSPSYLKKRTEARHNIQVPSFSVADFFFQLY